MIRLLLTLFACGVMTFSHASGDTSRDVERVRPAVTFKHEVEVQLPGERAFRSISITGPRLCGKIPRCSPDSNDRLPIETNYNWYKIIAISGKKVPGLPLYFLTPATILGQSKAEGDADGTNILLAFSSGSKKQIGTTQSIRVGEETLFLLRPIIQRHHDESFPIIEPACRYVVRTRRDGPARAGEIHTVDQFGLHRAKRLSAPYRVEAAVDL